MKESVTIKNNHEFRRMYAKGKNAVTPGVVVYCRRNRLDHNRLGVTVSTKVGKAVVRNLVRRRLREIFRLNQDKLLDGMYCGNDCSAFVSMSQFGTSHAASYLNTTAIAKSTYYRTLSDYDKLRPGDILVKSGDHTVLFLYYVDAFKTKMMIIEQGGNGSTVICSVFDTSWFTSRGYVPRRQVSFSMN